MPMKNQEKKTGNPESPLKTESAEQAKALRMNAEKQIAELKLKLKEIQEQSVKTMHEAVTLVLKKENSKVLSQINKEQEDNMKSMENQIKGTAGLYSKPLATKSIEALYTEKYGAKFDAGKEAMAIARKEASNAMEAAEKKAKSIEDFLRNIPSIGKPVS